MKWLQTGQNCIGFLFADQTIVAFLLFKTQLVVVLASIGVVVIGEFLEVGHSCACLLQNGNADSHVVGRLQILALLVLQVFLPDVQK